MSEITFHVLTLFPEMVMQVLSSGIIGRAAQKGILSFDAVNIRDYTADKHGKVDDYPYGGGAGMLMQAQPVYDAYRAAAGGRAVRTVYVTPQGAPFTQQKARELSGEKELIFLCGHYEGIDERVLEEIVTDHISIGDYVLTGGELAALVMIDAVARLVPGVLGNSSSAQEESFHNDLLEYPQYSRPEEWRGKRVPEVLLSGDHKKVSQWRLEQSRIRTIQRRPDLYEKYSEKQRMIRLLSRNKRNHIHMTESLARGNAEILYSDIRERECSVLLYDRNCHTGMAVAADRVSARKLADCLPDETRLVIVSDPMMKELLSERQYSVSDEYSQVLYTAKVPLPVRYRDIRPLSMENFLSMDNIFSMQNIFSAEASAGIDREYCFCNEARVRMKEEYIRGRIQAGAMFGVFSDAQPVGFIGFHEEGSLGLLFVEQQFRRQGFAASLEAYGVNLMLEKGQTPYGYVEKGNVPSERLQEKLGFYQAEKTFWRMEKTLANQS